MFISDSFSHVSMIITITGRSYRLKDRAMDNSKKDKDNNEGIGKKTKWDSCSTGLSRSACGGDAPTSFCGAHSRSAAGPSDTGLAPSAIEGRKRQNCLELWNEIGIKGKEFLAGFKAPIPGRF